MVPTMVSSRAGHYRPRNRVRVRGTGLDVERDGDGVCHRSSRARDDAAEARALDRLERAPCSPVDSPTSTPISGRPQIPSGRLDVGRRNPSGGRRVPREPRRRRFRPATSCGARALGVMTMCRARAAVAAHTGASDRRESHAGLGGPEASVAVGCAAAVALSPLRGLGPATALDRRSSRLLHARARGGGIWGWRLLPRLPARRARSSPG